MAETIKICKHNINGTGHCDILGGYCVEGPCSHEELAEYAPVRHGRWIGRPLCGNSNCRCSVCGFVQNVHANLRGEITQNYCPNCGADMREKED